MREFETLLTFEEVAEILRIVEATPRGGQLTIQFGDASIMLKMTENTLTINSSEAVALTSYTDNRVASPEVSDTQETPVSLEKEGDSSVKVRSQNLPAQGHDGLVAISAPLTGIFYRSSSPSDPPFIEIDSAVEEGQQVGIIEVMKLMNRIVAPCSGVVREICAKNQALAEYGTILMWIEPDKAK